MDGDSDIESDLLLIGDENESRYDNLSDDDGQIEIEDENESRGRQRKIPKRVAFKYGKLHTFFCMSHRERERL